MLDKPLSEVFTTMSPKERVVYYFGDLAYARATFDYEKEQPLSMKNAETALKLTRNRECYLFQKKVGISFYEYILEKASPDQKYSALFPIKGTDTKRIFTPSGRSSDIITNAPKGDILDDLPPWRGR